MTKVPDYLAAGHSLATLQSDLASLTELTKKMAESADRREARIAKLEVENVRFRDALQQIANAYDDCTGGPRFVEIAAAALKGAAE